MPLEKPRSDLKIAILLSAYKRPEYTAKCVKSIEEAQDYPGCHFYLVDDGSMDGTADVLMGAKLSKTVMISPENEGLRNTCIDFFSFVNRSEFDIISKIDNDCKVPFNWLNDILDVFYSHDVDVLSPNVFPSNAAMRHGKYVPGLPYRPANVIGGLWTMKANLIKDVLFCKHDVKGLKGAVPLLRQIVVEHNPNMGWLPTVIFQDMGHWSGEHDDCIKTKEHEDYYAEVGREIAWHV